MNYGGELNSAYYFQQLSCLPVKSECLRGAEISRGSGFWEIPQLFEVADKTHPHPPRQRLDRGRRNLDVRAHMDFRRFRIWGAYGLSAFSHWRILSPRPRHLGAPGSGAPEPPEPSPTFAPLDIDFLGST